MFIDDGYTREATIAAGDGGPEIHIAYRPMLARQRRRLARRALRLSDRRAAGFIPAGSGANETAAEIRSATPSVITSCESQAMESSVADGERAPAGINPAARCDDEITGRPRGAPDAAVQVVCGVIADHLVEWDLVDRSGALVKITPETLAALEPELFERLYETLATFDDEETSAKNWPRGCGCSWPPPRLPSAIADTVRNTCTMKRSGGPARIRHEAAASCLVQPGRRHPAGSPASAARKGRPRRRADSARRIARPGATTASAWPSDRSPMTRSCAAMPRSSARRRTRRGVQGSRVGRAQRGPPQGRPRRA